MSSRSCLENWQGSVSRGVRKTRFTPSESSAGHGLPLQRAPKQCQRMVSGGCCEGLFPDTVCWTRLRNTWDFLHCEIVSTHAEAVPGGLFGRFARHTVWARRFPSSLLGTFSARGFATSLNCRRDRNSNAQDTFDHDKGQKSAISGRRLHWRLSTGFFAFSPGSLCNLVRRAP